ncbi:hypothetical protein TRFO_25070 [Tritrichomonas foetus]|uniref:Endoplasmic reticulum-Golgi intermediate compartment protein 3 n=1 Tax=Tritrichomonas foetus TaxID=1144522 RepID=A0A1J4K761_9EUKA|nr:hypothetical protein TRFO_25070 [Tritrichomonas foetus]|eukprot:OHT06826.1 hypothetical protein TRFO_25070 [Tritrichomonas foetus]
MFFKKFDVFPKYADPDVKIKTKTGALLSLLTLSAMTVLFLHEFVRFVKPRIFEEIIVDTSRVGLQRTMGINFNLTVFSPCNHFYINAWDSEGNQQIGHRHEIQRQRVDENGLLIGEKEWLNVKRRELKGREKKKINPKSNSNTKEEKSDFCGSCYGAAPRGSCCNTCDDVISAFKSKGWGLDGLDRWQQCIDEGYSNLGHETCILSGVVRVNRAKGTLLFSTLSDVKPGERKSRDISRISKSLNLSHTFQFFEFGPRVPGSHHPLDGLTVIQSNKGRMVYSYHMNVVPTRWVSRRGFEVNTYKFTPVFSQKNITVDKSREIPGIYFHYDIAPLAVISRETAYSVWEFLTSVCAIVGGAFTCASLADQFFFRALTTLEGKAQIGKHF